MNSLMAFDTSYLFYRSFFGVPDRFHTAEGISVNAVRGTLDAVARLVSQYSPSHAMCAWDDDWRPAWRVDLVPSYKAHRVADVNSLGVDREETPEALEPQVGMIRECLQALGLPPVGVAAHEADDVLGSAAAQFDGNVLVVTGDRDLFQLVSNETEVIYVGRGVAKHEVVTPAWIHTKYQIAPERYVDFAVLRGDPSDGLPGVKGIGEKTAATLVSNFSSLEALVDAAQSGVGMSAATARKLTAASDYLAPARRVVEVVEDLGIPGPTPLPSSVAVDRCQELQQQWNLGGAMDRAIKALTGASE